MISAHMDQFIVTTQIKQENVRSSTLAAIRQNELQVVSSDVWSSGKSISDMISHSAEDDDSVVDHNIHIFSANHAVNSYDYVFDYRNVKEFPEPDWSKASWYIKPERSSVAI